MASFTLKAHDAWAIITSTCLHAVVLIILGLLTFAPKQTFEQIDVLITMVAESPSDVEFELMEMDAALSQSDGGDSESSAAAEPEKLLTTTIDLPGQVAQEALETVDLSGRDEAGVEALKGTVFGTNEATSARPSGQRGLIGHFYDFKQDRNRKKLPYAGAFPEYAEKVNKIANSRFAPLSLKDYYVAPTQLVLSHLMIPASTPATDAPKAFQVQSEVEPRGWMAHYSGSVVPPQSGEYRFVGFFDDLLIVYINNRPVLDGSWVPLCNIDQKPYDSALRQEFRGPPVSGVRTAYAGKWFKASGAMKIDIMIGETPGGLVGGLLMIERRGASYEKRPDGTPILPLFTTSLAGYDRVRKDPFASKYQLQDPPPLWRLVRR